MKSQWGKLIVVCIICLLIAAVLGLLIEWFNR